jgi:hypothetical protein
MEPHSHVALQKIFQGETWIIKKKPSTVAALFEVAPVQTTPFQQN